MYHDSYQSSLLKMVIGQVINNTRPKKKKSAVNNTRWESIGENQYLVERTSVENGTLRKSIGGKQYLSNVNDRWYLL